MPDNGNEDMSFAVVEGVGALSALSRDEYRMNLKELLSDPNRTDEERLLRVGRLMGVMLKEPFSMASPLDPAFSVTGAFRAWDLEPDSLENPITHTTWQYALMRALSDENNLDSVQLFAEYAANERGYFNYLATSFRAYVCNDPAVRRKLDEAVSEIERRGGSGQLLSPQALLGTAGTMIATSLVVAVPWLSVAATPILAGFVVIAGSIGLDAFCAWAAQAPRTEDAEKR